MGRSKTIPAMVDKRSEENKKLKDQLKLVDEYHSQTEFELTKMIENRTTDISKELLSLAQTISSLQGVLFSQDASITMLTKNLTYLGKENTDLRQRLEILTKFTIALFCCIIILTIKILGGF